MNLRLKLAVVANEFFDPALGRLGGFGSAARQVARLFEEDPGLGVDVIFLTGEVSASPECEQIQVGRTRLILKQQHRMRFARRLRSERIDLLLTVDYRPSYRPVLWALSRTPVVVWVRDPRTPEDVASINTLRIPSSEDVEPQGIHPIDCTSLRKVANVSRWLRRTLLFSVAHHHLADKIPATYGARPQHVAVLPNILEPPREDVRKAERPRVVFLGRLDPIKRPWVFVELARRFPEVEFILLGKMHFQGTGAWEPGRLPRNVRMLGHVDGAEKLELLSSAWLLVNTSIHESLAISFLEALLCETPILSCQDPGGIVSRFGVYVGRWDGSGLGGIPRFAEGLQRLIFDEAMRVRLGKGGRAWVEETHYRSQFLESFDDLCARAGIRREPDLSR